MEHLEFEYLAPEELMDKFRSKRDLYNLLKFDCNV